MSTAREPPARLRRGRCRLRAQMAAAGWVAAGPLGYLFLMWMERNIMPQAAARCAAALRLAGLAASFLPARGSRGLLVFWWVYCRPGCLSRQLSRADQPLFFFSIFLCSKLAVTTKITLDQVLGCAL